MTCCLPLIALLGCALILVKPIEAQSECERLKQTLEYTQEDAPRDFTKVLGVVTTELNKEMDGVVSVDVEWNGSDLHGRVGEHIINCKVFRLASMVAPEVLQGREVHENEQGQHVIFQCFQVPFTIYDTNECKLPKDHDMRHQCDEPSICVNTIGSYECMCPRLDGSLPVGVPVTEDKLSHTYSLDVAGDQEIAFFDGILHESRSPWELSMSTASASTCPSRSSTRGCCPEAAHSRDGQDCRRQFQCPFDPCPPTSSKKPAIHQCDKQAQCVRKESPRQEPNYMCACPDGLLGNGRTCRLSDAKPEPKVTFEGVPTDETVKANFCGCTKPVVDACAGFPPCTKKHEVCVVGANDTPRCGCKKGFVKHETFGCVDERPPEMKLVEDPRGDKTLRLQQGDSYIEHGVRIVDANAEDYERMLRISYSDPVAQGCLTRVGEFHVNYTISTPWTDPSSVVITRRVIIEDIDECAVDVAKYESTCPQLIPRCDFDAGAQCVNTIGSYTCACPKFTAGDGFQKGASFLRGVSPEGFQGGTSCQDTSKPVIELKGPIPKIFRISPCGGISGIMQRRSTDHQLKEAQRQYYESDIKEMIKSTQGAELCATSGNQRPRPSQCINAYDETYKGKVDLSSRVVVGDPVRKSELHWAVPYNVKDDAGNEATTVWREVVVEEVDVDAMEAKIRDEMKKENEAKTKHAVAAAVEAERQRLASNDNRRNSKLGAAVSSCPAYPKCGESEGTKSVGGGVDDKISVASCEKMCEQLTQQCNATHQSYSVALIWWLEQMLPPVPVFMFIAICILCSVAYILRLLFTLVFYPSGWSANNDYFTTEPERAQLMLRSVTYHSSPDPRQHQLNPQVPRTMQSQSGGNNALALHPNGNSGLPPRQSMSMAQQGGDFFMSPANSHSDIRNNGFAFSSPDGGNHSSTNGNDDIYAPATTPRNDGWVQQSPSGFRSL